jgi:trk system potassium uptake protein TrkH
MGIKYRVVARAVGAAGALTGIAMLPALAVSLSFREYREAAGFAICFAATLLLAGAALLAARLRGGDNREHRARDGILIVSVWWIASSVLGGLPYVACGVLGDPADAVFESASGFTTTGVTILSGLSALPRGVLLWRSTTGWIGGLEILAASFAVLPLAGAGYAAAQAESSANLSERLPAREHGALSRLCSFYVGSSLILFLFLNAAGTAPFDALLLALGATSTSGFSGYDGGSLDISGAAAFILCPFMLLAAVNFTFYRRLSTRRAGMLARDEELRAFFLIALCAAAAIAVDLLAAAPLSRENAAQSVGNAFFEAISAITTTGYHRADVSLWPAFCKILLLLLMLTGGCVASVASGVKVGRIVILLRLVQRNISIRLHPNAVLTIKFDGKAAPTDTVNAIAAHAMLCIAVFFIATAIVSAGGASGSAAAFDVLACMSNAGPGMTAAQGALAAADPAAYSLPIKLFLSFLMILGRLEFTTVLLLFTPRYWKNE